jgi:predicted TIM-barrel fold metal-dependent hydrolase
MRFFDCCCEVGPRNDKDVAAPWSAKDVIRWMDHCGIDGALVVHTLSRQADPTCGREALAREIAIAPNRLFPVWTILPPHCGDFEQTPNELLAEMEKADVRAVKVYPFSHGWPLTPSVIGSTLSALAEAGILLLIDFPEAANGGGVAAFEALDNMLGQFPKLRVLLQNAKWSDQRMIVPLMESHPNLHIEFSSYQINRGLEEYARRFGAERLLFGSGMPCKSAGAARAFVDYALIPDEQKALIAGGNLSRLLGGITPAPAPERAPDAIRDNAAKGLPATELILDAHCHILPKGINGAGRYVMTRGDAEGLVEIKDAMGVETTAIMSWNGPVASDMMGGNATVSEAVAAHPNRFLGVASVNPTHFSRDELMAEIRRRVEVEGFVGLKPYPRVGLKYNDDLYKPCWEYANERGLYALLHIGGSAGDTDVVEELAKNYPNAQWLVAHTGSSWAMARKVAASMKKHNNIWGELTYTAVTNGLIEWLVSEVGDDRILFGTDAPMRDPRPQLGWVIWANIPEQSRKRILGENFRRLLGQ